MQLGAVGVDIFHILIDAAAVLAKLHNAADIFGRRDNAGLDDRLADCFHLVAGRKFGRIVDIIFLAVTQIDFINNTGRGSD